MCGLCRFGLEAYSVTESALSESIDAFGLYDGRRGDGRMEPLGDGDRRDR